MTIWYTARGAGLAALVMLTLATAAGALASARLPAGALASARLQPSPIRSAPTRVLLQYLHRSAAVAGLALILLHVTAILADSYAGVGWLGAMVPFASGYRPGLVALGSIAAYLFVLVAATGAARGRLTRSPEAVRLWRGLHLSAYLAWAVSALHGFTIGSDSDLAWARWLYLGCVVAVAGSLALRLAYRTRPRRPEAASSVVSPPTKVKELVS
ncbi:Ferric reductase like transmembrane component [Frankineae bacterium MT45]|nr:Ferric reductase like transmembrane component [Frankineae bacterium MT45]